MNKCQGLTGLIFGHKFRPRYSLSEPSINLGTMSGVSPTQIEATASLLDASKSKTYEGDICERCGHKVVK